MHVLAYSQSETSTQPIASWNRNRHVLLSQSPTKLPSPTPSSYGLTRSLVRSFARSFPKRCLSSVYPSIYSVGSSEALPSHHDDSYTDLPESSSVRPSAPILSSSSLKHLDWSSSISRARPYSQPHGILHGQGMLQATPPSGGGPTKSNGFLTSLSAPTFAFSGGLCMTGPLPPFPPWRM